MNSVNPPSDAAKIIPKFEVTTDSITQTRGQFECPVCGEKLFHVVGQEYIVKATGKHTIRLRCTCGFSNAVESTPEVRTHATMHRRDAVAETESATPQTAGVV